MWSPLYLFWLMHDHFASRYTVASCLSLSSTVFIQVQVQAKRTTKMKRKQKCKSSFTDHTTTNIKTNERPPSLLHSPHTHLIQYRTIRTLITIATNCTGPHGDQAKRSICSRRHRKNSPSIRTHLIRHRNSLLFHKISWHSKIWAIPKICVYTLWSKPKTRKPQIFDMKTNRSTGVLWCKYLTK